MLSILVFIIFIVAPVALLASGVFTAVSVLDKVTAKPEKPARVVTAEELAASKARVTAMLAQAAEAHLAAHHH